MYGILKENPKIKLIEFLRDDVKQISEGILPSGKYYYEFNDSTNQLQALNEEQFINQMHLYVLQGFELKSVSLQKINEFQVERIILVHMNSDLVFGDSMGMATGYLQNLNERVIYGLNYRLTNEGKMS